MAPVAVVARPHVSDLKIDPIKDLISVIQLSRQPLVIAVHPSLGVRTLTELVAAARREPGLRYGLGGGIGNEQHILAPGLLNSLTSRLSRCRTAAGGQRSMTYSQVT